MMGVWLKHFPEHPKVSDSILYIFFHSSHDEPAKEQALLRLRAEALGVAPFIADQDIEELVEIVLYNKWAKVFDTVRKAQGALPDVLLSVVFQYCTEQGNVELDSCFAENWRVQPLLRELRLTALEIQYFPGSLPSRKHSYANALGEQLTSLKVQGQFRPDALECLNGLTQLREFILENTYCDREDGVFDRKTPGNCPLHKMSFPPSLESLSLSACCCCAMDLRSLLPLTRLRTLMLKRRDHKSYGDEYCVFQPLTEVLSSLSPQLVHLSLSNLDLQCLQYPLITDAAVVRGASKLPAFPRLIRLALNDCTGIS